jgi:hypothetical protein
MLRRSFLGSLALPFLSKLASGEDIRVIEAGWINNHLATRRYIQTRKLPFLSQQNDQIKNSGSGKVVMLHPFLEKAQAAPIRARKQGIGDCVGQAFANGVDILTGVQIHLHNKPEKFIAPASAEIIYGGGRIEIAQKQDKLRIPGSGSTGSWAADWVTKYGPLLQQKYAVNGKVYDLTKYDSKVSKEFGSTGVPDELEPLAQEHPVKTAALVTTWQELIDSIANGYPVVICSALGFGPTDDSWVRDKDGYLRRSRMDWNHAMLIFGYDDASRRKGACFLNSWGDVHGGPTLHDNPPTCSFWVDKNVVEVGLKNVWQRQSNPDSYALSNYVGYPYQADKIPDYTFW